MPRTKNTAQPAVNQPAPVAANKISKKRPKYAANTQGAPNTGTMLRALIKQRRIHQSALARALGRRYEIIADYQKRGSMQTTLLWEICLALKHNLFLDIATQLPAEFATNAPVDTSKDERIAALERELEIVKAERDILIKTGSRA